MTKLSCIKVLKRCRTLQFLYTHLKTGLVVDCMDVKILMVKTLHSESLFLSFPVDTSSSAFNFVFQISKPETEWICIGLTTKHEVK